MIQPIGYLKLWREIASKPIWLNSTPEQKTVLITIMMMVNFKPKQWEWKGEQYTADKGQVVTSLDKIVENCGKGVTVQNVRTALKRFEKLGFLTNESTKTGRLITIGNWEVYQSDEENQQSNQQRPNKDLTPREEGNKEIIKDIVDYLNKKTDKSFKASTKKTVTCIMARFNEGYTEFDDFKKVVDVKVSKWLGTDNEMYLRPETLFGNKFEGYLNESPKKQQAELLGAQGDGVVKVKRVEEDW